MVKVLLLVFLLYLLCFQRRSGGDLLYLFHQVLVRWVLVRRVLVHLLRSYLTMAHCSARLQAVELELHRDHQRQASLVLAQQLFQLESPNRHRV